MVMFNAPPVVIEEMKVHSNNKNYEEHFINNDELDISNSILKSNEEICNGKDKDNVEENLKDIVHDVISSNEVDNCYNHEKLGNYGISDALINNNCQNDGSDIEEPSSTSDKCNNDIFNRDNNNISEKILSKRLLNLVDSDTDEEATWYKIMNKKSSTVDDKCHSGLSEHLESIRHKKGSKNNKVRRVIDSESEDDIQTSNLHDFNQIVHKSVNTITNNYQTLIDSESEEEKEVVHNSLIFDNADTSKSKNTKKESVKKRKGSIRASKDEAMRQIHSESQRLLRETKISLPYHRPKQRTLQEFLNRKKISAVLPKAPSTAAKLKMASAILSQALAEKEKEAELFYKSSDSEDDMQQPVSFASKDIKQSSNINEKMALTNIKQTCIQDIQDIKTNNKDSYNERGIVQDHLDEQVQQNQLNEQVQQDHLDEQGGLDASGTLFGKDFCEANHQNRELFPLTKNNNNRDDKFDILSLQIDNGHKQDLQKLGVSRKLFDTSFKNETNEISDKSHDEKATKAIVETLPLIITSFDKEKCINDKSEMSMTENHSLEISKTHQCYSEMTNGNRHENLIAESMKILDTFNNINNEKIAEMLHKDNNMTSNVVKSSNFDDCTIIQDKNNERKDKCIKANEISSSHIIGGTPLKLEDNSLIEKCEKINSHVLGLPLPKFTDETLTNREKLLPKLALNSKVTLKGSPGMIIDLTDDTKSNGKGVNILLDRFFCKHVINTKNQTDNKSEVTVTYLQDTQEDLLLSKEFSYKLPTNTDNSELNKPGAKLKRLKEDLKLQMVLKRNKEWKQKEVELQAQEKEWNEKEESDYEFYEQEQANNFGFSDSDESEPEENDVCIKDKKRKTHLFADDEAEVTDDEGSSTSTEETYNENDMEHRKEHIDDNISEVGTDQEEQEDDEEDLNADMEDRSDSDFKDNDNANVYQNNNIVGNKKNRKTKQLIKELRDNSNIKNSNYLENNQLKNITIDVDAPKTFCKDNSWINENEDNVPIYQQHAEVGSSQLCNTPLAKTSILDIVSPITQLSVLNSPLDSNKKDSSEKRKYLVDKDESLFMKSLQNGESSEHSCNIRNKIIIKKKLFDDVEETINDDDLMQLCSGKFEFTQNTDLDPKDLSSQSNTNESQLPELCSGNINMKLTDIKQLENSEVENEIPENVKLTLNEDSDKSTKHVKIAKKISPVDSALKLRIVSSDDEDLSNEIDTFLKPKNRLGKRFNLSDSEEEIVQSSDDENNDIDNEEAEQYIDYDSEENEVIIVPKKDIKKVATSFLEEEAILSESDWDSADEDEKDLDKLEFEEADTEHIDERKVKDQLEKIHMKQILDEDKREVRLLKELLFEDGDLHTDGTGRERKFKWRNIDKLGNNSEVSQVSDTNDGWVDMQEDEEEAKWHKLRHERDKFLEERMKCSSNEIEDELCDSQIFKFGLEAFKKIKDNKSQKQDDSLNKIDLSENMEPIVPRNITDLLNGPNIGKKSQTIYNVMKKRSLLTRGEESLARIASLAKQGDPVSHNLNTRNFVFQYIDPSTDNISKENETREDRENKHRKRKVTSDFPLTMKKRRK